MGRRLALLIATHEHEDPALRRLTAPAADVEALAAVLRDPAIAGFEVTVLINEPHYRVGEAIAELYRARRRDDLTFLYFTGHGLKDDDGRLYLATSNTRRDSLLFTSLPAEQLDYAMEGCASRQKVLVLDCCYSGAFPAGRGVKADTEVHALEKFQGRGRTVLTASDSTQYSFEGDQVHGSAPQSVFTRHLVEGLREGSADLDGDGDITVDELYSYVHDRVVEEMPQQRPKKQSNVEGRIVIARNVGWTLPGYLRNALGSPIATDRLGALEALLHLHRIGNSTVQDHVVAEIERLADDDSRTVSAAAEARLRAIRPEARPDGGGPAAEVEDVGPAADTDVPDPQIEPSPARPDPAESPAMMPSDGPRSAEHPADAHDADPAEPASTRWRSARRILAGTPRRLAGTATCVLAAVGAVITSLVVASGGGVSGDAPREGSSPSQLAAAGSVVDTVAVGAAADGIALFGDGSELAGVAVADGLTLVHTPTLANNGTVKDVPGQAADVAVTPGLSPTYVATDIGLTKVDSSGPTLVVKGAVIDGEEVYCVAAAGGGNRVYAATRSGVEVLDARSGDKITTVALPGQKFGLAVSPDSTRVYVANTDLNTVAVIDAGTTSVIGTIETGAFTEDVAVSPDGARGYVAQESAVAVFATNTQRLLTTIPTPGGGVLEAVAVTPDGSRVFAVTRNDARLIEIDAATGTVTGSTTLGAVAGDVAVTNDRAYVSLRSSGSVVVLDISGG